MELPKDRPEHSPIGASSRHRWAACPGSVDASEGLSSTAGRAAIDGTFAHELAAYVLEKSFESNLPAKTWFLNYTRHIDHYVGYCQELRDRSSQYYIEHGFNLSTLHPWLYGTADFVSYEDNDQVLNVVDYKHGENIVVEVKNNLQLEYYALGALLTLKLPARKVRMTIVQPRAFHPDGIIRHWEVDALYFLDVEWNLLQQVKEVFKPKPKMQAGDHCMFCPAKKECEVKAKSKNKDAEKVFSKQFGFRKKPSDIFDAIKE